MPVDYAGQSYTQTTYLTHPWMFTDGLGNCIEMFMPQKGVSRFEITVPNPAFGPDNDCRTGCSRKALRGDEVACLRDNKTTKRLKIGEWLLQYRRYVQMGAAVPQVNGQMESSQR